MSCTHRYGFTAMSSGFRRDPTSSTRSFSLAPFRLVFRTPIRRARVRAHVVVFVAVFPVEYRYGFFVRARNFGSTPRLRVSRRPNGSRFTRRSRRSRRRRYGRIYPAYYHNYTQRTCRALNFFRKTERSRLKRVF